MRTAVTSAPRARNPSSSSGFDRPYSCTAMRRSGRPSVAASTSRHVFGSGTRTAGEQLFGELESLVVVLERSFAHGWRDERVALLAADELCDLRSAAAFEGE